MRSETMFWPSMSATLPWTQDDWSILAREHIGAPDIAVVSVNFDKPRPRSLGNRNPHFPDYEHGVPMPWQPELEVA